MKTDIWMPVIIGDYLKDTRKLNTEEHGSYFLIMMEMWVSGGYIETRHLPNVCLLSKAKFKKVWLNLEKYFEERDGKVSQKRLLIELQKSSGNRQSKQNNGKLGGRPVTKTKPAGNLEVRLTETSSPSPLSSSKTTIPEQTRKPDLIWDSICEIWGFDPQTTTEKKRIGKIVRDMKKKKATPEFIKSLKGVYEREWPNYESSPEALLKHWDKFSKMLPTTKPAAGNQANMNLMKTRRINVRDSKL